jgi:tetratricopeptide (TPR) repeat protein
MTSVSIEPKVPAAAKPEKPLSAEQAAGTLAVPLTTLSKWSSAGLIGPPEEGYDFRDLVALRTIKALVDRGASPSVIKRSLRGLARCLTGIDRPLTELNLVITDRGRVAAELDDALLSPGGQLEIRFERRKVGESAPRGLPIHIAGAHSPDVHLWIAQGLEAERAMDLPEAEQCYRRAIRLDPVNPSAQLNLGNVLLARGRRSAARERFSQAAALDPSHACAWFNLAHTEDLLGRPRAALRSLYHAVRADPEYADAWFNLADLAERLKNPAEADRAWARYLRLDPAGEWALEARRRLNQLRSRAWA